jgi:hypothetical protein
VQEKAAAKGGVRVARVELERSPVARQGIDRPLQSRKRVAMVQPRLDVVGRDGDQGIERLECFAMQSLLCERNAKADEILRLGILLVGAGDPLDGVVIIPGLQQQQTHQVQAVGVMRVHRKRLLAAELRVEIAAGLHLPETKLMQGSRRWVVLTFGSFLGLFGCCLAFTKVHIGALLLLDTSADS